jgi:sterol desaturase/sphingolipid hydroxylase (fatty acid hydroxylase superfamily)
MSLIVYSIPIFFLLIGVELLITRVRGLSYYRFNDAITNLSCGIGSQVTGIFMKFLTFGVYVLIYNSSPLKGKIPYNYAAMIALFIGVDFFYYWFHRLAHEVSIMWGSHVVHHQSEEYNLSVALRQAWVQGAFSWVFYLPLAIVGFDPYMFATIASLQTLYQFWIHTKVIGRMPAPFEYVFNTPSHHRVHHGVNPKYIDKNHAGTLIIWDRIFGTFQQEEEEVVYGITTQAKSWNPLWVNFEYWIDLFKDMTKVHKAADAFRMLVLAPGWKPQEMGGMLAYKEVTPATFQKYDTSVSPRLNNYIFFQFVVLLLGTSAFLFGQKNLDATMIAVVSGLIIYTVVTIGGLFERKTWVVPAELIRIIVLAFIIGFIVLRYYPVSYAVSIEGLYLLPSIIWFSSTIKEINSNQ